MENFYINFWIKQKAVLFSASALKVFFLILLTLDPSFYFTANAQGIIPTRGKDFWIGFPKQPNGNSSSKRCELFITSEYNTSGIVLIPLQGWSLTFTVIANQTTTLNLPVAIVEHISSQTIDNKGIQVLTLDTVSLFAISFQNYTADATVVYPKQSLGTQYRIASYQGLNGNPTQFLIVATEDGTQIIITPTAPTANGNPAGIPFTVNLNAGQSYQVRGTSVTGDFTGSTIAGSDSSGSCRPFAVFSGTQCVNIPVGCTWCDILFDQALPVTHWGKTYYSTPFASTTKYTIRILADQNNTSYSINGAAPVILNAGQFTEINNITTGRCISANKPISVIQYMQGRACAGSGDPSMMYLNAEEQKISQVTFSTVTSAVISQHFVNVIMNSSHITQLKLDGIPVLGSAFTPFPGCGNISYAALPLTQGSHTLDADSGFSAYAYGTGQDESYAYSVGSFSKSQPIQVDSVLCSSDTIHLGNNNSLFSMWWSTLDDPTDTIAIGPVLTLIPPIIPGIYILHGNEYISGCDRVFYFAVEIPDPPQIWASSTTNLACTNNLIQLNSGTIPPMSGFQYSWTPTTGLNNPNIANPILTAATSGWYQVAISANNNCTPIVYDSVYIEVLPLPSVVINTGGNQTVCYGDPALLTANGGVSYLWVPGGFTGNAINVSPLVNTDYIVYVSDSNGCFNSDTVSVIVNPLPVANAGNDVAICTGTSALLTATGGITYVWNPGGIVGNTISVNPLFNTWYSVQVTDANGCINTDSVWVLVNPIPVVNAGPDLVICRKDTVILSATGGVAYMWNPGNMQGNNISVAPAISTTYVVTAIDANGCINGDNLFVTVNQLPFVTAGADQAICYGTVTSLGATGANNFNWIPGNINGATLTVSPIVTTNFIVTGTDSIGCKNSDTLHVTVNPLPVIGAGSDQSTCSGNPVILTATGGISYNWMPGNVTGNTFNVNPIINTTYIVTGTDINGCENADTVSVTVNPLPTANAGPDAAICIGFSTTLTASGGVSYLWTPGGVTSTSITVSPTSSTAYVVTVIDANGCYANDTTYVSVYSQPLVTAGPDQAICIGASTMLTASGASTYSWYPGNMIGNNPVVNPSFTTLYTVTGTDLFGCSASVLITVIVNPLPVVNAGNDQTLCAGFSANLSASGGLNYLWTPGNMNGNSITVTPPVSTIYTVIVTDANGCVNNGSVSVNVNPLPVINISPDQYVCPETEATLTASGGVSFIWNPGNLSGNIITLIPIISQNYTVQVTDINGCVNTASTYLGIHPLPISEFRLPTKVCEQTIYTFNNLSSVSSGTITDYNWDFGDGTTSTDIHPSHIYSNAGIFNVNLSVLSNVGCTDNYLQAFTTNPLPQVNFQTSNQCSGLPVFFTDNSTALPTQVVEWFWEFGDGISISSAENPEHIYSYSGWYEVTLTVVSDSGCVASKKQNQAVFIYPLPEASFKFAPHEISILNPVVHFYDQSIGATSWWWEFGYGQSFSEARNPVYTYRDTGLFSVRLIVTSIDGCRDTADVELNIDPYYTIFMPNAFSPNGDGINEEFIPNGIGIHAFEMMIFDRWGKAVFRSGNMNHTWNGKSENGLDCSQGVYVYKVKVKDFNDVESEFAGQLTLIR